jgi:5'-methylthioadenosine phosphorylase
MVKVGIIGGSGLDDPKIIQNFKEIEVETPFGKPSSKLTLGKIKGIDVVIIARHGKDHSIPPTQVNNKANIYALKDQKCDYILATTAVGSLKKEIKRGDLVILDQFIDFTRNRELTFFNRFDPIKGPKHTPMAWPFSRELRKRLAKSCRDLNLKYHWRGTVITIEGPRFSTIAESNMFRKWGADVINMSIAPEAILANEAEIEYSVIAMSTDYDCWKQDEEPVSWDQILEVFLDNADKVKKLLVNVIESFSQDTKYQEIKNKIRTIPDFPKPGIQFRDLTTLFQNKQGIKEVTDILYEKYKDEKIDLVAGIESRGFIIAGSLAEKLGCGFVPIRKKGKLPRETISQEYELEYGTDSVEIHKDAIQKGQKVLLIDDLIATGGTALASCQLIEKLGGEIVECAFIVDLPDLKGKEKLSPRRVFAIVEFEGE